MTARQPDTIEDKTISLKGKGKIRIRIQLKPKITPYTVLADYLIKNPAILRLVFQLLNSVPDGVEVGVSIVSLLHSVKPRGADQFVRYALELCEKGWLALSLSLTRSVNQSARLSTEQPPRCSHRGRSASSGSQVHWTLSVPDARAVL